MPDRRLRLAHTCIEAPIGKPTTRDHPSATERALYHIPPPHATSNSQPQPAKARFASTRRPTDAAEAGSSGDDSDSTRALEGTYKYASHSTAEGGRLQSISPPWRTVPEHQGRGGNLPNRQDTPHKRPAPGMEPRTFAVPRADYGHPLGNGIQHDSPFEGLAGHW